MEKQATNINLEWMKATLWITKKVKERMKERVKS